MLHLQEQIKLTIHEKKQYFSHFLQNLKQNIYFGKSGLQYLPCMMQKFFLLQQTLYSVLKQKRDYILLKYVIILFLLTPDPISHMTFQVTESSGTACAHNLNLNICQKGLRYKTLEYLFNV